MNVNHQLSSKMENQVSATIKNLTDAWAQGDAQTLASLFTNDATYTVWYGAQLKGKMAIEKGHEFVFSVLYPNSILHLDIVDIRFLGSDVALAHTEASILAAGEQAGEPEAVPLLVLHKINGVWKIAVLQNTLYAVNEFQQNGNVKLIKKMAREYMQQQAV